MKQKDVLSKNNDFLNVMFHGTPCMLIPGEKAVICKSFVCYVHILFVYFRLHTVVLSKTRKLQYTNRVNLSVFTVHLVETLLTHLYSLLQFS